MRAARDGGGAYCLSRSIVLEAIGWDQRCDKISMVQTHTYYIFVYIYLYNYIYISHIYMYMYIMGMIVLFASHRLRIFLVDPPEVHLWRCGGRSGSGDDVYQWRLNVALRLMQIIYDI
jgi:hypothetical protein